MSNLHQRFSNACAQFLSKPLIHEISVSEKRRFFFSRFSTHLLFLTWKTKRMKSLFGFVLNNDEENWETGHFTWQILQRKVEGYKADNSSMFQIWSTRIYEARWRSALDQTMDRPTLFKRSSPESRLKFRSEALPWVLVVQTCRESRSTDFNPTRYIWQLQQGTFNPYMLRRDPR